MKRLASRISRGVVSGAAAELMCGTDGKSAFVFYPTVNVSRPAPVALNNPPAPLMGAADGSVDPAGPFPQAQP
jgi:hypothetical protein